MLRKVVRPDKSAVIFKYDAFGRRIEKCITGAGSEKVISFAEKKTFTEESEWETIGGVRIRKPNMELQKPHVVKGDTASVYAGESTLTDSGQNATVVEKVIRFLWDGNTILHEREDDVTGSKKPQQKIDYQADYVVKLSEKKKQEAKEKTANGELAPESLVTWIFQDDFIPRAKITKDGCYSIMTDYLGTPVGAYDETGNLVWERELDINGKVMPVGKDSYGRTLQEVGGKTFIPFRFQGQYEDEEIGLYYNRFRYYDSEIGQYTQQDPIGLAGGNPTLYGYVWDTNWWIDPFGLNIVEHFSDFDAALRRAFELATDGDSTVTFIPKKYDPLTGTEVEFKGSNGSKIAFDSPHADMSIELGHDKPHIGVNTGGKRTAGQGKGKKYNLTYDGDQHPYRASDKGKGVIECH